MTHKIKIEKPYADAVLSGDKTFEVRYDDRGYQKGDLIEFNVIDNKWVEINHPLNDKEFEITYVLHGWGLKDSWCVFSIKEKQNERSTEEEICCGNCDKCEHGVAMPDQFYDDGTPIRECGLGKGERP